MEDGDQDRARVLRQGQLFGLTIVILGVVFKGERGLGRKRWWLDLEERDGSEIRQRLL